MICLQEKLIHQSKEIEPEKDKPSRLKSQQENVSKTADEGSTWSTSEEKRHKKEEIRQDRERLSQYPDSSDEEGTLDLETARKRRKKMKRKLGV